MASGRCSRRRFAAVIGNVRSDSRRPRRYGSLWDGQPRHIKADGTGSTPLVGMLVLDSHNVNIEVERGGLVAIEARAWPAEKRAFWRPAVCFTILHCLNMCAG